jgi:hypothetical protein
MVRDEKLLSILKKKMEILKQKYRGKQKYKKSERNFAKEEAEANVFKKTGLQAVHVRPHFYDNYIESFKI